MTDWRHPSADVAEVPSGGWPALVVPLIVAGLMITLGRPMIAVAVLVITIVLAALRFLRPAAAHRVDALVRRVGHVVSSTLSWLLLTIIGMLVIVPVSLVLRLLRKDPLGATGGQWLELTDPVSAHHTFGREHVSLGAPPG